MTAATSQAELDAGRRFIFLFTDLSNPTSNKIYRQIGYEPVIDVDQIAFAEHAEGEPPRRPEVLPTPRSGQYHRASAEMARSPTRFPHATHQAGDHGGQGVPAQRSR